MKKSKVSFKVPTKLWGPFHEEAKTLGLTYSILLDRVLSSELPRLAEEMAGLKQSLRARRQAAGAMKRLDLTSVNVALADETAELLRSTVKSFGISRDALMCRLVLMLRSPDALLKMWGIPKSQEAGHIGCSIEPVPTSPLEAVGSIWVDPFFYMRESVREHHGTGLYLMPLDKSTVWAEVYINDEVVEGTTSNRRAKALSGKL